MTPSNELSVLVIEDEPEIRKFLQVSLQNHGFRTLFAETAKEGVRHIEQRLPDTVILDLSLPDMDGLEVIRQVRTWSRVPIIVLSARGQEQDKISALELGADDYLTKPFGTGELLARIRVAQRHIHQAALGALPIIESGALKIELDSRIVSIHGVPLELTPTEFKLLKILAMNIGKVVTNKQLLTEVWGKNAGENGHYLRIYVQHLRRKLGDDAMHPQYIFNETGIGYRLKQ